MWFLRKTQAITDVTKNTWLFFFLFSVSVTLQVQSIYEFLSMATGVNHIGWLISYMAGMFAPYVLYKALDAMVSIPHRSYTTPLYKLLIWVSIILCLLFPQISREPVGANEAGPYTIWILLFRLTAFLYAVIAYYLVAFMLYRCQQANTPLYVRMRWILLSVFGFWGASYFAVRMPYWVALYFNPDLDQTAAGAFINNILHILEHARLGWIFFFLPNKLYEWLFKPFEFMAKVWMLLELTILKRRVMNLLAAAEILKPFLPPGVTSLLPPSYLVAPTKKWFLSPPSLDLILYRTLIAIIDAKKILDDINIYLPSHPVDTNWHNEVERLQEALYAVPQDADFDTLLKAYRQVSYQTLHRMGRLRQAMAQERPLEAIQRAQAIVANLNIDFQHFTMAGLIQHLEALTGRKIIPFAIPMPPFRYGAWISDKTLPLEYIFYDANLSSLHQIHTQLHEIGHFLCGHQTLKVSENELASLLRAGLRQDSTAVDGLLMRAPHVKQKENLEAEAEAVAMVLQTQIIAASRMEQLAAVLNNNTEAIRFLRDMGVQV